MNNITITFNGKTREYPEVTPGIVKSGSNYLILDRAFNEWKYLNQARLNKLVKKYKTIKNLGETYESVGPATARLKLMRANEPKISKPKPEKVDKPFNMNVNDGKPQSTGTFVDPEYRFPRMDVHPIAAMNIRREQEA